MKREAMISLPAAVLSLAFVPFALQAQSNSSQPTSEQLAEAQHMVQAQAIFDKTLDARKAQQGQQFEVTLNQKVKLNDGQELPKGTTLMGTVVSDDNGGSKLVLRFTQAHLKEGKDVPIQAMITGVYSQDSPDAQYGGEWTPSQTEIDQEGAMHGINLHSSIGSDDSGTFEAKSKDDVKFSRGSSLSLAIASGSTSAGNHSGN